MLGNLRVLVMRATDLRMNDGFLGSTNAYVKVVIGSGQYDMSNRFLSGHHSKILKTSTASSTTTPEWREKMRFQVDSPHLDRLIFYLFDASPTGRDMLLGKASVPLKVLMKLGAGKQRAIKQMKLHVKAPSKMEQAQLHCADQAQGSLHVMVSVAWRGLDAQGVKGGIQSFHGVGSFMSRAIKKGIQTPQSAMRKKGKKGQKVTSFGGANTTPSSPKAHRRTRIAQKQGKEGPSDDASSD